MPKLHKAEGAQLGYTALVMWSTVNTKYVDII